MIAAAVSMTADERERYAGGFVGERWEAIKSDCWGIARRFYDGLGYGLPFIAWRPATVDLLAVAQSARWLAPLEAAEWGALIVIAPPAGEAVGHLAVSLGDGRLLTASKKTGSVILRDYKLADRIQGYFRVTELYRRRNG